MSRPFTPKVVTANLLREGDVVYLSACGAWSLHLSQAELLTTDERAQERLAFAAGQDGLVVGAYLADARAGAQGAEAVHFREAFRASGPTNYPHGKAAPSFG